MTTLVTYTGSLIDPHNPDPFAISIFDIANALSRICRFSGNTPKFYSVAEHSIRVSKLVPDHMALEALLHDATEAYLGDVPAPVKNMLPDYKEVEERFQNAIDIRFGLPALQSPEIKMADYQMLLIENQELMRHPDLPVPDVKEIPYYASESMEQTVEDFLSFFVKYGGEL